MAKQVQPTESVQPIQNHKLRKRLTIAAGVVLALLAAAALVLPGLENAGSQKLAERLREHFRSDLQWSRLHVSLRPTVQLEVENLTFRRKGHADEPPLISIRKVTGSAGIFGLLRTPKQIGSLSLEGLLIQVSPKRDGEKKDENKKHQEPTPFVVNRVTADGTRLRILPKDPSKDPLEFDIQQLKLHSAGTSEPMRFDAVLQNAKPPGLIRSQGKFGPWNVDDAGETPVSGDYTFRDADLGVFHGISGKLSSDGHYTGALGRITVDGKTDTPDFMVKVAGQALDLRTEFHAVVDGTNGDTQLQPVTAHFLRSTVVARGEVAHQPGPRGKTVTLDVTVNQGRVEDMLQLAVKQEKPTMRGAISFQAKMIIPPGKVDIDQKIQLDGQFGIGAARFTDFGLQKKLTTLSERAQGNTENDGDPSSVLSDLNGRFTVKDGTVRFSELAFRVPGAAILLSGTYNLRTHGLDFNGVAQLQAKLSEMTTGIKSTLLKAIDGLFAKKDVGTELPIHIRGTKESPAFGLDVKRAIRLK